MNLERPFHWFIIWGIMFILFFPLLCFIPPLGLFIVLFYFKIPSILFGMKHFSTFEWGLLGPNDSIGIILTGAFYLGISALLGQICAWFCRPQETKNQELFENSDAPK